MNKIHYETGASVTIDKVEIRTLCKKTFFKYDQTKFVSGFLGKKKLTCKNCIKELEKFNYI